MLPLSQAFPPLFPPHPWLPSQESSLPPSLPSSLPSSYLPLPKDPERVPPPQVLQTCSLHDVRSSLLPASQGRLSLPPPLSSLLHGCPSSYSQRQCIEQPLPPNELPLLPCL